MSITPTLAALSLAAGVAGADVIQVGAARDNTLYQESGGALSNGAGPSIFAGKTVVDTLRRGLLGFDVSAIPAGSTVTSVTLTLECTRSASGEQPVSLRPATAHWGEGASIAFGEGGNGGAAEPGDATWLHTFFPGSTWTTPGGDFGGVIATTIVAGEGTYTWTSGAMIADVQGWVDNPAVNFGWGVFGNEDVSQSAKRFASRENADAGVRPVLEVEYTPIPAPAVVSIGAGAVLLTGMLRRQPKI